MLHSCLVSTLLCFVYTLRCFYIFSATNLLTICHSASCLFSSVFCSRKAENQYSRNWTGQELKSIFYRGEHEAGIRDGGESPGGTPLATRVGHPAPGRGCSRPGAPCLSSSPIRSPRWL